MHSSGPLSENKAWNIFISLQKTTVDDSSRWHCDNSAVPSVNYAGRLSPGTRRCAERSLGGASVRQSSGMADGEADASVERGSVDGGLTEWHPHLCIFVLIFHRVALVFSCGHGSREKVDILPRAEGWRGKCTAQLSFYPRTAVNSWALVILQSNMLSSACGVVVAAAAVIVGKQLPQLVLCIFVFSFLHLLFWLHTILAAFSTTAANDLG